MHVADTAQGRDLDMAASLGSLLISVCSAAACANSSARTAAAAPPAAGAAPSSGGRCSVIECAAGASGASLYTAARADNAARGGLLFVARPSHDARRERSARPSSPLSWMPFAVSSERSAKLAVFLSAGLGSSC